MEVERLRSWLWLPGSHTLLFLQEHSSRWAVWSTSLDLGGQALQRRGSNGIQWDPPARHNISMIAVGLPAEIPVDPNKIPVKSRSEILQSKVLGRVQTSVETVQTGVEMGLSVSQQEHAMCKEGCKVRSRNLLDQLV